MSKIVIASDSSCDLSKELVEKYDIKIIPYTVVLDDKEYKDGVNITPDELYAYHKKTGKLPRTAAINFAEAEEIINDLKKDCDELILFTLSGKMSSTNQYINNAAAGKNGVYIIDSKNLSTGCGHSVIKAAELAQSGKSGKEIADFINNDFTDYVNASFVIDSLEYLRKGGRCSSLAALGANLLKLKPCIEVKEGTMSVGKKYHGNFEDVLLNNYIPDRLMDAENISLDRVFITHAGCDPKLVEKAAAKVKELLPFKEVLITRAGATVSVHCGANTLGVLFVQKTKVQ